MKVRSAPILRFGGRLATVLLAGVVLRGLIATLAVHNSYDLESFKIIGHVLRTAPLDVYETNRWQYPPAFFPVVLVSQALSWRVGVDFSILLKVPVIVADAATAWLVQDMLRRAGAGERTRLAAAALVSFGPSFVMISGYDNQIDSVAILPALIALHVWDRSREGRRREVSVALLVGIGAAVKTVPILLVLAFVPLLPSWRRRFAFAALAASVPAALLLPWIVANPSSLRALWYAGFPGVGGLSVAVQPNLPFAILTEHSGVTYSSATRLLQHVGTPALGAALIVLMLWNFRRTIVPRDAAITLWLGVYVFLPSFFFQYAVWGMPFFIAGGYLPQVAVIQGALVLPMVIWALRPWNEGAAPLLYTVSMLGVWVAAVIALCVRLRVPVPGFRRRPRSRIGASR